MTLGKRGIIFLALSFVAFIFAIVGTPLRMATVEQTQSPFPGVVVEAKVTYTMWKICTKVKQFRGGNLFSESNTCRTDFTCANDLVRAARAFSIMSIIVLALVCCVLGALDMLCKLPADPKGKLILIAAAAVGVAFTVITWACQVGLYRDDCTGQSVEHADGSKIRESAPLFIVATGLMLIATIVAAAVPGPVEEVHTVAGKAEVVNPDGTVDAVPQNQPETKVPVVVAHEPVVHGRNEPVA